MIETVFLFILSQLQRMYRRLFQDIFKDTLYRLAGYNGNYILFYSP